MTNQEKISPAKRVEQVLTLESLPVTQEEKEFLVKQASFMRETTESIWLEEIRYAVPALNYQAISGPEQATAESEGDLTRLKQLDAIFSNTNYSDEVLAAILPHFSNYLKSLSDLRSLPLGEVQAALVMLAGGKR
jgi:hypothetical protein